MHLYAWFYWYSSHWLDYHTIQRYTEVQKKTQNQICPNNTAKLQKTRNRWKTNIKLRRRATDAPPPRKREDSLRVTNRPLDRLRKFFNFIAAKFQLPERIVNLATLSRRKFSIMCKLCVVNFIISPNIFLYHPLFLSYGSQYVPTAARQLQYEATLLVITVNECKQWGIK